MDCKGKGGGIESDGTDTDLKLESEKVRSLRVGIWKEVQRPRAPRAPMNETGSRDFDPTVEERTRCLTRKV